MSQLEYSCSCIFTHLSNGFLELELQEGIYSLKKLLIVKKFQFILIFKIKFTKVWLIYSKFFYTPFSVQPYEFWQVRTVM